jgi:hypothetical protein
MAPPERIKGYSWPKLRQLWSKLHQGDPAGFDQGKAFEFLVLRAFSLDGLEVVWPFSVPSEFASASAPTHQIDGAIFSRSTSFRVESKHWRETVDYKPVALLIAHLKRRPPGTMGILMSLRGPTDPASELALLSGQTQVLFWSGHEIDWALKKRGRFAQGLEAKYRYAVSHAAADFDLSTWKARR